MISTSGQQAKRDPQVVSSDGLASYRGAHARISLAKVEKAVHMANVSIRSHMRNHRAERLTPKESGVT